MLSKEFKKMFTITLSLFTFLVLNISNVEATLKTAGPANVSKARVMKGYGNLPLSFIQNDGQIDEKVKFYERGKGHTTFFTKAGMTLVLTGSQAVRENDVKKLGKPSDVVRLIPLGANKNPEIVAEGRQEGVVNYFIGNDAKKWKTNIPTYQAVLYKEIYPDIDLRFYGNNRQFEYDVIVKPGADPSTVRFGYEGIEELKVTENGELEIALKEGKLTQNKPYIYQEIDGKRIEVAGKFVLLEQQVKVPVSFGFEVAAYNKDHPLIIDPVLVYSTYLGGSGSDSGNAIAVDDSGNVYIIGNTTSRDFPSASSSPIQGNNNGGLFGDIFVTKINPVGTAIVYSTYLGGTGSETGIDIAVDSSGNAYIIVATSSTDFPTDIPTDIPIQGTNTGGIVVAKINASGTALLYSTIFEGFDSGIGSGIAVDGSGNAYITGTGTFGFPASPLPGQTRRGGGFVAKINPLGDTVIYSIFIGDGRATDIAVDGSGVAYITGATSSRSFPTTPNAIQRNLESGIGSFFMKINNEGNAMLYSTYLGGSANAIAVDSSGNVYITGVAGRFFPTSSPLQESRAGDSGTDAFVTKINADGTSIIYSTFLGGSRVSRHFNEAGHDIAVDARGNAYITGETAYFDFPTLFPIQEKGTRASQVAFVTKISSVGTLSYSTYLGGVPARGFFGDTANGIAVDAVGNAYITGKARTRNFPTISPIMEDPPLSAANAFVSKISDDGPNISIMDAVLPINDKNIPFGDVSVGSIVLQTVTLINDGNAPLVIGTIGSLDPIVAPLSIQNDTCSGQTLASGTNCTFVVRFSPISGGIFSDIFDIPSNDPNESTVNVSVSGTGTLVTAIAPDITVTPLNHTFRNITEGNTLDQDITIKNDGNANLDIGTLASPDGLAAPFSILDDLCSNQSIPPAGSCTFKVRFAPTTTGIFTDTFDIPSNDTDENPVKVSVSGTGLSSAVNQLPTAFQLVFPEDGASGLGPDVTFGWNKSTDPDGDIPSYTLKVCEDVALTTGCFTNEVLAAVKNKGIDYTGLGLGLGLVVGFIFIGRSKDRRKAGLLMATFLVSGLLLVSCGGGGGGGSNNSSVPGDLPGGGNPSTDITKIIKGLKTGQTYHWQVVADDGNGGTTTSEKRTFTTQ